MDAKIAFCIGLFQSACALVYLLPFKKCDRNKYPAWQHLNTVTGDEEISKEQKHPATVSSSPSPSREQSCNTAIYGEHCSGVATKFRDKSHNKS